MHWTKTKKKNCFGISMTKLTQKWVVEVCWISIINRGFNTARWSDISLSQNLLLLFLLLLFLLLLQLLPLFMLLDPFSLHMLCQDQMIISIVNRVFNNARWSDISLCQTCSCSCSCFFCCSCFCSCSCSLLLAPCTCLVKTKWWYQSSTVVSILLDDMTFH